MRNATLTLSATSVAHATRMRDTLTVGGTYSLTVENRSTGVISTRTVQIVEHVGSVSDSTGAVKVMTDKGPRTLNLWLVSHVN